MVPAARPATPTDLPAAAGTYVVAYALRRRLRLTVGRLGRFEFGPGVYLYVGSARGPGGLRARLGHHWRSAARPHWHVDYLRHAARPIGAALRVSDDPLECRWAGRLAAAPGLEPGPAGFGASDCRCPTHLFRIPGPADARVARQVTTVVSYQRWLDAARVGAGSGPAARPQE